MVESFVYVLSVIHHSHFTQFFARIKTYFQHIDGQEIRDLAIELSKYAVYRKFSAIVERDCISYIKTFLVKKPTKKRPTFALPGKKGLLFFPEWTKSNPYQKLLYSALNSHYQITVEGYKQTLLTRELLEEKRPYFSYIHVHWLHTFFTLEDDESIANLIDVFEYAKELGYHIIYTAHNLISHESTDEAKELAVRRKIVPLFDTILVHGNSVKARMSQLFGLDPEKIFVVHHGCYDGFYPNTVTRAEARAYFKIKDTDYVFLFFGALRKYKGVETLLEVYTKVHKTYKNCRLIIAGRCEDSELEDIIQEALKDKSITYCNEFIPDNMVQYYFNAADMSLFTYNKILTSGSLMLSLTFDTPVIAPADGVIQEIITPEQGHLYKDTEDLQKIMESVVASNTTYNFAPCHEAYAWESLVRNEPFASLCSV
jgi:glycosyltransferase involved in cell wall biosynthesis